MQKNKQGLDYDYDYDYDYVIVGSGFGGSVSALRLSEKGYKVLVIEKGQWYKDKDYAKSAWNLKRWLWMPWFGLRGIMKISVFRHVTVYSGVGVGGGSLTYGATLPTPKAQFFNTGTWAKLQNWQQALAPFYDNALTMLGASANRKLADADIVIKDLANDIGKSDQFEPSRVGIFFSDKAAPSGFEPDPYFSGKGPERKGCIQCGSCMTGCSYNAKNTLDKNYLHLAQNLGAKIQAETLVTDVQPLVEGKGQNGYQISCKSSHLLGLPRRKKITAKGVIFAGGVLGTIPLLLKLKAKGSLPELSNCVGKHIRTNNETITAVTSFDNNLDFTQGVAIGSVLHTDEHSHLEPIRYNQSSGVMKFMLAPRVAGQTFFNRLGKLVTVMLTKPKQNLKVLFADNWGKRTLYLLFMQHLDSTLSMKLNMFGFPSTKLGKGKAPTCQIPASDKVVDAVEQKVKGKASMWSTEAFLGTPSTAHVLGGAVMAESAEEGVINDKGEVFGYQNMYVCDGSMISANPGVNPSLSITAISEWCMSHIEAKSSQPLVQER